MTLPVAAHAQERESVRVVGTELVIALDDGRELGREQVVGTILTLRGEDGQHRRVKIESVAPDPTDPTGGVLLYRLTWPDAAGAWQPVCSPGPDGLQAAILQPGADGELVIWCTSGALGKCVRYGYHPWRQLFDGTSLAPYHRACVNMARADYCGDDRPTTNEGMQIEMQDRAGVRAWPPGDSDFRFEAAWGEQRALCVARVRVPENISLDELVRRCPRLAGRTGDACTPASSYRFGTPLIFNRSR
jgi:hypothetical protein